MKKLQFFGLMEGIGGFSVAAQRAGFHVAGFCEINPFCQFVLKQHYPKVPLYSDIYELDGKQFRGTIDIVSAGFPCQPFSIAGKRNGTNDERFLFPQIIRFLTESKPSWFIGENVIGLSTLSQRSNANQMETKENIIEEKYYVLPEILESLISIGYSVQVFSIGSVCVGYNNIRQRLWILANRCEERRQKDDIQPPINFERCQKEGNKRIQRGLAGRILSSLFEVSESDLHNPNVRFSDKSFDVLATETLGNAINPDIATIIFSYINAIEHENFRNNQPDYNRTNS